ncbi:MFS transporter [Glacieibacterium frigidum]|uniref:MFS transporter n=1 Tax=Glacieibacterium frigidum TaxID=2593303 RepID=A0A552UIJ8_9SPHN|nr:MFS transporter [Glacieibacterium frigidum]
MGEFRRGSKVLAAAFLGVMCGASPLPFNVLGTLFKPLQEEFGWNRAEISGGITVFGIVASLMAPVFGWLADRYGVRRVALSSLGAFIVAFAAMGFTPPSLVGYYALWFFVGLVGIGSTPVTWSRAISLWFLDNRGLALGIMLIGTSAAAFVVPGLAVWAIDAYGWRAMFPIVAMLPLLVALPIGLLWFREPRPDERPPGLSTRDGAVAGMTFGAAAKTRQFWTLWVSILLIALAYGGAHIHLIPIVMDHGFAPGAAAAMMGVVGLGLLAGRIGVGFLLDRIWGPAIAFPVLCLPAVACFLLLGTSSETSAITVAAFLLGFAAGAESDLIAFLAARYFGMAHFGRIYGMLYMPFGLFSAVSPLVYGIVRDRTGSYDGMLMAAAVLFVAGGALLLTLGRYPGTATTKLAHA